MHIWFHLLMWHAGQLYWLGAWETQGECQSVQIRHEQEPGHASDRFWCPPVNVEKT